MYYYMLYEGQISVEPTWREGTHCQNCQTKFSISTRKHHWYSLYILIRSIVVRMLLCVCTSLCTSEHLNAYVYFQCVYGVVYVHMCMCMYVCIRMYIRMCVCICMYISLSTIVLNSRDRHEKHSVPLFCTSTTCLIIHLT